MSKDENFAPLNPGTKLQRDIALIFVCILFLSLVSGLLTFGRASEQRLRVEEQQVLEMQKALTETQIALRQTQSTLTETQQTLIKERDNRHQ